MARMHRTLAVGLIAILAQATLALGSDLYVSTTGTDIPDCSDELNPCRTIQHAVDVAAPLGDVIHVEAGTHVENVIIDRSLTIEGAAGTTVPRTPGPASTASRPGGACGRS